MTSTTLEFTSATKRREPLPFTVDGETYVFAPPKSAVMMLPVYTGDGGFFRAQYEWFEQGLNLHDWANMDDAARRVAHGLVTEDDAGPLGPEEPVPALPPEGWQGPQAARLEKRLRDPADKLDTEDLDDIINGLTAAVAGRPTT